MLELPHQSPQLVPRNKIHSAIGRKPVVFGEKVGYWLCANCLARWACRRAGHKRLFVIGTEEIINAGTYYIAYSGRVSDECEAVIDCLKGCEMLAVLGDRDITTERIVRVIEEANNLLDHKLTQGINEVQLRVSKSTRCLPRQLYCEDKRLSLPRDGMHFKTIMHKDVDREVFQLDNELLMSFLDMCARFMNIENGPTSGPAAGRIKKKIQSSELFQMARSCLSEVVHKSAPYEGRNH